jgi:hypothetical protein
MIFPLTDLLADTEACVCFSCYGTALACQYCLCSITWFRVFPLTGELDSLSMRAPRLG